MVTKASSSATTTSTRVRVFYIPPGQNRVSDTKVKEENMIIAGANSVRIDDSSPSMPTTSGGESSATEDTSGLEQPPTRDNQRKR